MRKQVELHIVYEGQVQGVGFRFTAIRCAQHLNLAGYVRNMPDGTVQLMAQGTRSALERLLLEIRRSSVGAYIRAETISWSDVTTPMRSFTIRD